MVIRLGLVAVLAILAAHGSWSSARLEAQAQSSVFFEEQAKTTRITKTGAGPGSGDELQTATRVRRCPPTDPDCDPVIDPDPVPKPCARPSSATLVATPSTIQHGQSATLEWAVRFPSLCTPPAVMVNGQTVEPRGTLVVTPMSNQRYVLYAGNTSVAQTTVTVELPAVVRIKGNTADWKRLLIQALEDPLPGFDGIAPEHRPGRTVLLAHDVDMDLTNYENLHISQGVTLTSELPPPGNELALAAFLGGPTNILDQGPVARNAFNLGPRLYTTSRPLPLFHIECNGANIFGDRVRLIGFRLQGPHFETEEGDDNTERAIMITSCSGVEISNMEISGWSGQAIYIQDQLGRISAFDDVKVLDNFIHHNQHKGESGYGVDTSIGAMATIERNVFDFNRHAITASADEGVGYRARNNLVLKGGGVHGTFFNPFTHQFDVHGDATCLLPDSLAIYNCGNAGQLFEYVENTFQFTVDHAIKIRGVPREPSTIHHNVFAHDDIEDAVNYKRPPSRPWPRCPTCGNTKTRPAPITTVNTASAISTETAGTTSSWPPV